MLSCVHPHLSTLLSQAHTIMIFQFWNLQGWHFVPSQKPRASYMSASFILPLLLCFMRKSRWNASDQVRLWSKKQPKHPSGFIDVILYCPDHTLAQVQVALPNSYCIGTFAFRKLDQANQRAAICERDSGLSIADIAMLQEEVQQLQQDLSQYSRPPLPLDPRSIALTPATSVFPFSRHV